jgi:hypothetical protein
MHAVNESIDLKDVTSLASVEGPCISLIVETGPIGRDRTAGRIRLKNQLVEAENTLTMGGMRATLARDLLEPTAKLLNDEHFWEQPMEGLAIYVAPRFFKRFYLSESPATKTVVGDRFFVRPLLANLRKPETYVLALDQQATRLLKVDDGQVSEVQVPTLPKSISEVVGSDYSEKQRQMHSAGPHGSNSSMASHGAGDRAADSKDRLHRFAIAIDRAVNKHLGASGATLVLAADEPFLSIYRKVNRYPGLMVEAVVGNPKLLNGDQIKSGVDGIVEHGHARLIEKVKERFAELEPKFLASDSIEHIAKSVDEGRVGILMTKRTSGETDSHSPTDLRINEVIVGALKHGTLVYEIAEDQMPTKEPLAAVFRY